MIFRHLSFYLIVACLVFAPARAAKNKPESPAYKGAIVLEATTGKVLLEDNPDIINPPASVTKLMTFLVVHDKLKAGTIQLDTPVTITGQEANIGGTQVYLKEKETFPVEELIYAMMIQSANDAAMALARVAGGSREGFVQLMNARASQLGMNHTTFRSPHGLPPASRKIAEGDLTTPRDLATLCRELLQNTDVLKYSSVKQRAFGTSRKQGPVQMINHNHLLGKISGVDGLKTGFTNGAGFCLAATAERNGRRIIAVVMGSPDRVTRDLRMGELIERGFAALPPSSASPVASSPVSPISAEKAASAPTRPPLSPVASDPSASTPATTPPTENSPPPTVTFPKLKKK